MRILVVTHTFFPVVGGAEVGIHEIYSRIGKKHEVLILAPRMGNVVNRKFGGNDQGYVESGYKVIRFNNSLKVPECFKNILWGIIPPVSFSMAVSVLLNVKRFKPDVVNFQFFKHTGLAVILLKLFTKVPVVLSLVGRHDVLCKKTPFFWRVYLKLIVSLCDRVTANSGFYLDYKTLPNLSVIPYGVDCNRFSGSLSLGKQMRERLGLKDEQKILFTVQRLAVEKRVDVTIEAMKEIAAEFPDCVLLIAGKGPEYDSLRKVAADCGVEGNVRFLGYVSRADLPAFYACCDIFVFHSLFETFGVVFAEAFASGKPVVSVNTTAIPEIIIDNYTGLLVPALDPRQFAGAVLRLLKDNELYSRISLNVRKAAVEKYNWDIIADKYNVLYLDIQKGKRKSHFC